MKPDKPRSRQSPLNELFTEHGKVPPQAIDLEEVVLGALMLEPKVMMEVADELHPEVFYKTEHQMIFGAIQRLYARNTKIDVLTVHNELKQSGEIAMIPEGAYYLTMLTNRVASSANILVHAGILKQKYFSREIIRIGSEMTRDAYEDTTDVFDLMESIDKMMLNLHLGHQKKDAVLLEKAIKKYYKLLQENIGKENKLIGVPSGYIDLDRLTGGWQKSDLIILASRPGMGKTAMALCMARNAAIMFKKPVAIFSLEMSTEQLTHRFISAESEIYTSKLRNFELEGFDIERMHVKINELLYTSIYIDDTPALSIYDLQSKARRLKALYGIEIMFVDYLQLMHGSKENRGNREREVSEVSQSLKALAKELEIPIIALSQLSRECEKRPDKKPILSDLRESGSLEQDADVVGLIYRPAYYMDQNDSDFSTMKEQMEVNIAKHRNGPTKTVLLRFIGQFTKVTDFSEQTSLI